MLAMITIADRAEQRWRCTAWRFFPGPVTRNLNARQYRGRKENVLSGDGGHSAVCSASLAIEVLGDELDVEGLPSSSISSSLLLLAGHDLKEHRHSGGLIL